MKEVSSCQICWYGINQRKRKKKGWIRCSTKRAFFMAKSAQLSWKCWPGSNQKAYQIIQIILLLNLSGLLHLIVWTDLFDKRSLPWRSVAEACLVNHERFPGRDVLKSTLLNGQTWFARSGTRVAELGSLAGFKKKLMPWLLVRTLLQP